MRKSTKRIISEMVIVASGMLTVQADWVPSTGGTYDYATSANWSDGVINNVFLPTGYAGTDQTIRIASDGEWNAADPVVSAHTNGIALLLRGEGGDRNLTLGGVSFFSPGTLAGNKLQFGTTTAGQNVNFSMPNTVVIDTASASTWSWLAMTIFNGSLSGAGGVVKTGDGDLYLQNAASTFSGGVEIRGGRLNVLTAGASLASTNIVVGRSDAFYTGGQAGVIGHLVLGNRIEPEGSASGSAGANANRIPDAATVELQGGSLWLTAADGDNNSLTETIGTVSLTRGVSTLAVSMPAALGDILSNVVSLHIGDLNRAAGTAITGIGGDWSLMNAAAFGSGAAKDGRITVDAINGATPSAAVVNGIIPWALHAAQVKGTSAWAPLYGDSFLTYGENGLTPVTEFVTDVTTALPTDNLKLDSTPFLGTTAYTVNSLTAPLNNFELHQSSLTLASGAAVLYGRSTTRKRISTGLNFNGREAILFQCGGRLLLSGILSNTDNNGLTYSGVGIGPTDGGPRIPQLSLGGVNSYTGPTRISGGLLRAGGSASPSSSAVIINEGGAFDLLQRDTTIASLSGWGHVWFFSHEVSDLHTKSTTQCTLTVGGDNTSTTFAGVMADSWNVANYTGHVVKAGSGTWTLSGMNTYSGTTTVADGGLVVDGALAAAANGVTVQTGAFLAGSGTIGRDVLVESGGLLAAGLTNTVGTLTISGNLTLSTGATLDIQLGGPGSGDRVVVGGDVALNSSALQISVLGDLHGNDQYTLIDNQSGGAIAGTFLNGGALEVGEYKFTVAYDGGTGNDVVLTVQPKGTVVCVR